MYKAFFIKYPFPSDLEIKIQVYGITTIIKTKPIFFIVQKNFLHQLP